MTGHLQPKGMGQRRRVQPAADAADPLDVGHVVTGGAGRDGGVSSVVGHEESGLLVAPGNVEAFAEATARLLNSDETRTRLSSGGKARIERRHSLAKAAVTLGDAIRIARRTHLGAGDACPSLQDQAR